MKKLSICILLVSIILSCRDSSFEPEELSDNSIESAKLWYSKKILSNENLRTENGSSSAKKLTPKWNKSKKSKFDSKHNIIIVETDGYALQNDKFDFLRIFIFREKEGVVVDGRIVEIIGDKDFINKNREVLPQLYRKKNIPGFNGAIFGYDMEYQYLDGYQFKSGKRIDDLTYIQGRALDTTNDPTQGRIASTLRTMEETEEGCWDVFWDNYTYGCACWSSMYLYTYCVPGPGSDGGGSAIPPGGTGGGGAPTAPPTNSSSPSMYVNSSQLTVPCLKNVWDLIRDANFNNKVQTILYEFNESKRIQFELKEHNSVGSRKAATTTVPSSGVPNISLNKWALRNASKEAIVNTIFHEVLHVSLNGKDASSDHTTIAADYIAQLAQAVQAWYPNLSNDDAKALAWTGLQGTDAWNSLGAGTKTDYISRMNKHFNIDGTNQTQIGTPCP